jgi:predicted O-methyltransferase YrrM
MASTGSASGLSKLGLLFSLLPSHPLEFYDRVRTMAEVRLEQLWIRPTNYQTRGWEEVIGGLSELLGQDISKVLDEPAVGELEAKIRQRVQDLGRHAPFTLIHNADFRLARLCYAVCRVLRPALVVETGVAYGVTSSFLLRAFEANGSGTLHSVDLPPLGRDADRFVGTLIPAELRSRWQLHRGASKRVLPALLAQLGAVDLFIHDSLHTLANMRREFAQVQPYLRPGAVVIADDIEGNRAFQEWVEAAQPAFWATVREAEKSGICGIGVMR